MAAPVDERAAVIGALINGRASADWISNVQRSFSTGRYLELYAMFQAFNDAASAPVLTAYTPFADLPTAVGD